MSTLRLALPLLVGCLLVTALDASAKPSSPSAAAPRVLTDFTANGADLGWFVVNDNVMGGRSTGGFVPQGSELRFRGSTNTNGGGFSSIRTRPLELDLAAYDGIRVRVRGDGRRYTWRLTTDARWRGRQVSYWADFETRDETWTVADIPFSAFKPQFRGMQLSGPKLNPRRIRGMGLMIYDKRDGPFDLRLDSVQAYGSQAAFSLADQRGKRRVLVLGAPSAQDARLRMQVEAVDAARAAFEERDLMLVIILENGASRAGDRVLTPDEVGALRKRLGVARGSFSLSLVGKDGGVKRLAAAPLGMQDLYDSIDSMPMRRTEMGESSDS
jgi:NADH dehydrogenase [ubiquinone] 1 alpha subcomplex assembly factor 1